MAERPIDIAAQRDERRRQATLANMRSALRSLALDIDRIQALGDDAAVVALDTFRAELSAIHQTAGELRDEFTELANLAYETSGIEAHQPSQESTHGH